MATTDQPPPSRAELSLAPRGETVPPTLRLTDLPPGAPSRAAIAAVISAFAGLVLVALAALWGLDSELPSRMPNATLGLRLTTHRGLLALSATVTLGALVSGVAGVRRSPLLGVTALLLVGSWVALVGWALYG